MHDPRPAAPADAGEAVAAMREEGIDQCSLRVAWRRVDDEAGRLVDDDQVLILKADRERDRLRHRDWVGRFRQDDPEMLARLHPLRRVALHGAVRGDVAGPDRLVIDLLLADGTRQLLIIDLATGRRLGTIPLR